MGLDKRQFRDALGWFTTGVAVVTGRSRAGPAIGITVNSFASVSLDPPLVSWCLDKTSDTFDTFSVCRAFTVNILHEDQQAVSNRLASVGDHGLNGLDLIESRNGCPRLAGALAVFECAVETRHDAGDHILLVGRVDGFDCARNGRPLLYHRGQYSALPD